MNMVETTLGVTSFFMGSVPRARMASICSVTIIEPSSLAMPEALRPATTSPARSGPSSRTTPIATNSPMRVCAPKRAKVVALFSANATPMKKQEDKTIDNEPKPMKSACWIMSAV